MNIRSRHGVTIIEMVVLVLVIGLLLGLGLPMISNVSCDSARNRSSTNLMLLAAAHDAYAADWNNRQFTLVDDGLSGLAGPCGSGDRDGFAHPPAILGEDCKGVEQGFFFTPGIGGGCPQFDPIRPMNFQGSFAYTGAFRMPNAAGFNQYVNGRFFDSTFYAPKDQVVLDAVGPFIDGPCSFPAEAADFVFSASYVLSPAAMFDPGVFRNASEDGWQDPLALPNGYTSPPVTAVRHAAQKSRMVEHTWLQTPTGGDCNPAFTTSVYDCEPYYFNHGTRSNPLTLFYDGHVRGLSVLEASDSDRRVQWQTGTGLWSRDTPFGIDGYLTEVGFDLFSSSSFHILTTDGILGRDTIR